MTFYQKAIKVRKTCRNTVLCKGENCCPYIKQCHGSETFEFIMPKFCDLKTIAKAIKNEKWSVK